MDIGLVEIEKVGIVCFHPTCFLLWMNFAYPGEVRLPASILFLQAGHVNH
jgi:hypothetical protein